MTSPKERNPSENKEIVIKVPEIKMPNFMKSKDFQAVIGGMVTIWLVLNLVGFIIGIADSNSNSHQMDCEKTAKIDYVFPGHQFGCWMGKETDGNPKIETMDDEEIEKF